MFVELTSYQWALSMFGGLVIGFSKSGIKGIFILTVTLMALVFGAKESTGVIVPLLIVGDIMAVLYYNRHAKWKLLFRFLPWMMVGVIIASLVGKYLNEQIFNYLMIGIILVSLILMLVLEKRKEIDLSSHMIFSSTMGLLAGITTMLGNLAGAFSNLYFLSARIPKYEFIGTAAWLFFIINLFKFPIHIFVWKTIHFETLKINLILLPSVFLGFYLGTKLIDLFNENFFRKFIYLATVVGVILLFFK